MPRRLPSFLPKYRLSMTVRLVLAMCLVSVLTALPLAWHAQTTLSHAVEQRLRDEIEDRFRAMAGTIDALGLGMESLSATISHDPETRTLIEAGERDALFSMHEGEFLYLKRHYGVDVEQFHTPPGISFLRVNDPAKFGDDLTAFRPMVVAALRDNAPRHGIERGVSGLSIRGIQPITDLNDEGRVVGSVEVGMTMGDKTLAEFKKTTGTEAAVVWKNREGKAAVIGETLAGLGAHAASRIEAALAGADSLDEVGPDGERPALRLVRRLLDAQGQPVAVLALQLDETPFLAASQAAQRKSLTIIGAALSLSFAISLLIGYSVSRHLRGIARALARIAVRDLDFEVLDTDRDDEIGDMARGIAALRAEEVRMAEMERQQAANVEQMHGMQAALKSLMHSQLEGVVDSAMQSNAAGLVLARMVTGVSDAAAATQTIASATAQLESSSHAIAETATRVSSQTAIAERAAQDSLVAADRATGAMVELGGLVSDIAVKTGDLAAESSKISAMSQQIEVIAHQSRLLALNATIEAERAGSAGRGFAVVAGEVKAMAEATGKATANIRATVEGLLERITAIATASAESRERAGIGQDAVVELDHALRSIAEQVAEASRAMTETSGALREQTEAAANISGSAAEISRLSAENLAEIDEVLAAITTASTTLDTKAEEFAVTGDRRSTSIIARNDHIKFKRGILDRVLGRNPSGTSGISDCHGCRLGKWLDAQTDERITRSGPFLALHAPHHEVHAAGLAAVEHALAHRRDDSFREIERMNDASKAVIARLVELTDLIGRIDAEDAGKDGRTPKSGDAVLF